MKKILFICLFVVILFSLFGNSVRSDIIGVSGLLSDPSLFYMIPSFIYDNEGISLTYDLYLGAEGSFAWSIGDILFDFGIRKYSDSFYAPYLDYVGVSDTISSDIYFGGGKIYSSGTVGIGFALSQYLYRYDDYSLSNTKNAIYLSMDREIEDAYLCIWGDISWGNGELLPDGTEGEYGPSFVLDALYKSYAFDDNINVFLKGAYGRKQWSVELTNESFSSEKDTMSVAAGIGYEGYQESNALLYIGYEKSSITNVSSQAEGIEETEKEDVSFSPYVCLFVEGNVSSHFKILSSVRGGVFNTDDTEIETKEMFFDGKIGIEWIYDNIALSVLFNDNLIFNTLFSYDTDSRINGDTPFTKVSLRYSF